MHAESGSGVVVAFPGYELHLLKLLGVQPGAATDALYGAKQLVSAKGHQGDAGSVAEKSASHCATVCTSVLRLVPAPQTGNADVWGMQSCSCCAYPALAPAGHIGTAATCPVTPSDTQPAKCDWTSSVACVSAAILVPHARQMYGREKQTDISDVPRTRSRCAGAQAGWMA